MTRNKKVSVTLERQGEIPSGLVNYHFEEVEDDIHMVIRCENLEEIKSRAYPNESDNERFENARAKIVVRGMSKSGILLKTPFVIDIGSWNDVKNGCTYKYLVTESDGIDYMSADFFIEDDNKELPFKLLFSDNIRCTGFAKTEKKQSNSFVSIAWISNQDCLYKVNLEADNDPYISFLNTSGQDDSLVNTKEMINENKIFFSMFSKDIATKLLHFIVEFDCDNGDTNQRTSWMQKCWRQAEIADYKKAKAYMDAYKNGETVFSDTEDRFKWVEDMSNKFANQLGLDEQIMKEWYHIKEQQEEQLV
jgi:hypothetical protein